MSTKKEYRINFTKAGLSNLLKRKKTDDMLKDAKRNGLKKTLSAFDLIITISDDWANNNPVM